MIKLLIVNESFTNPIFWRRWELLAEMHKDLDLYLLAPDHEEIKARAHSFGHDVRIIGEEINKDNFHILLFSKKQVRGIGWISPDFKKYISQINPNVIYNIGAHNQLSLVQLIYLRNKLLPSAKLLSFSMRGPNYNASHFKDKCKPYTKYLKRRFFAYYYAKLTLKYFNRNVDAVFCHYPDAFNCFRQEGYTGPIYMQTQVGVNPELFHEDIEARKEIRAKYHIDEKTLLFGSATRFTVMKGLDDILHALPIEGNWKYLMMGSGMPSDELRLRNIIKQRGLEDKVILPGFISLKEMPKYWNAIDCMLHCPRTAYSWVETFSIALVQGMITGKPVIGSDSGSVPYQIGPDGIIVKEGDIDGLRDKMVWVLNHRSEAKRIGELMKDRATECFSIQHLDELFYRTLTEDILQGKYDEAKIDMATYKTNL